MSSSDSERYARIGYAAYGATTDHKNYQGLPMPGFDELGETITRAWHNAAVTVAAAAVADYIARQAAERGGPGTQEVHDGEFPVD